MSNRRRLATVPVKSTTPVADLLRQVEGLRIYGGCEECDAYQTTDVDYWGQGLHRLAIHHDEWCPWFNRRQS